MREHGVEIEEAMLLVALRRGQVYGAGDLVYLHPLTPEQLRAIGVDHDPEQVIAADRARLAEEAFSTQPGAAEGVATPATSSDTRRL